ncbi:SHOCT domain-containing protein [Haloferacaceae archaeon DSL9]
MIDWSAWIEENPALAAVTVIFLVAMLIPLIAIDPWVVSVLATLVFLTWVVARLTGERASAATDDAATEETPVQELERRYVRGELTDEEFERRLSVLFDADDRVERERARSPERLTER